MASTSDPGVAEALANDLVIDITTIGRSSGEAKRSEIWFHNVDDRYYITGRPGPQLVVRECAGQSGDHVSLQGVDGGRP